MCVCGGLGTGVARWVKCVAGSVRWMRACSAVRIYLYPHLHLARTYRGAVVEDDDRGDKIPHGPGVVLCVYVIQERRDRPSHQGALVAVSRRQCCRLYICKPELNYRRAYLGPDEHHPFPEVGALERDAPVERAHREGHRHARLCFYVCV